jgi:glycosyltransferase involved in cell wall biosynthesis
MNKFEKEQPISICIPVYNGAKTISDTIINLLKLDYNNYEIIINDNCSTDDTLKIIKQFKSNKIKYFENKRHVSCGENINLAVTNSSYEVIVLQSADDLFEKNYLKKINNIFSSHPHLNCISRNYFWFKNNEVSPIRIKSFTLEDKILNKKSNFNEQLLLLKSFDNISGLAAKRKNLKNLKVSRHPFIEGASIMLKFFNLSDIYFIGEPLVAVRVNDFNSSKQNYVYKKSTTLIWRYIFNSCLKKSLNSKNLFLKSYGCQFESLIQIRCYGSFINVLREIKVFIKIDKSNLLKLNFLFYSFLTLLLPKNFIIFLNILFKMISKKILLKKIDFKKYQF